MLLDFCLAFKSTEPNVTAFAAKFVGKLQTVVSKSLFPEGIRKISADKRKRKMWKDYSVYVFSLEFRESWNKFVQALGLPSAHIACISQHIAHIIIEQSRIEESATVTIYDKQAIRYVSGYVIKKPQEKVFVENSLCRNFGKNA